MNFPRPPPVPGLIRRPVGPSPPPPSPDPPQLLSQSNHHLPSSSNGVVVVGFLSRRPDDSSHLINQVLDNNVFGSGKLNKILAVDKPDFQDWFRFRKICYYHEVDKGIVFVQFSPTLCPALSSSDSGFDCVLEEREFGDLQGLLFMFSVCHVIINIQEGSRFDTRLLKKFRVLQASKQALAPFVRSQTVLPLTSRLHSSSNNFSQVHSASSRGGGIVSRGGSSVSLKSGGGSYTSLFPGQCNPVTLFVFLDDFSDMLKSSSSVEDSTTTSSANDQSVNTGKLTRSELPTKNSGSVVVLSRPGSKSEGGLRKKLQSSLEAQVRFLIKKCRTLTGSDNNHVGSRSGSISSYAPLFSLDASKAVILLDRSNKKGEALEFASSLVDDVLNGKANSDSLLLENNCQMSTKEDVLCVKEFIYRCSDILRGKGGLAANSGSAGVGMVAVAAAAAAASTGSRKTYSAPQLPQLDEWLSCSHQILDGIITAKIVSTNEIDLRKKKSRERNMSPVKDEARSSKGPETLDIAVSLLGSGKGLNLKFSSLWCERAFPAAKDVYLKDLPSCYPTLVHEAHLQKALYTFRSMVRGPSVQIFTKRLQDECISIWESGRQLCDATSLTGKPCVHQRHNVDEQFLPGAEIMSHSSGYVFLHACACGRSRKLRCDPFDFDSANISFNCFPDCDKLLPSVKLPEIAHAGPIISSSWSLVRVGGSRYYEPSKGLLQSGFSAIQKFLLKLVLSSQKDDAPNDLLVGESEKACISRANVTMAKTIRTNIDSAPVTLATVTRGESVGNGSIGDKKISFGRGLPNLLMRKPFSEVVAGSKSTDLLFPPLQPSRHPPPALEKVVKQKVWNGLSEESVQDACNQECQEFKDISRDQETLGMSRGISATGNDLPLQNGSNPVPVNLKVAEKVTSSPVQKPLTAYIGFEHECPSGHRFLLNTEHLAKLGPSYSVPEEYFDPNSAESSKFKTDTSKLEKNIVYGKGRRKTNRMASGVNRMKNMDRSSQVVSKDNIFPGKKGNRNSADSEPINQHIHNLGANNQDNNGEDFGVAFSMLNRNLPIFMNCPHCSAAFGKKDSSDIKYAGTISQLQRIFLVTPQFPVVLATCPVIKFEESCLPLSIIDREQKLQFSLGCPVILPPDSFLSLRLPFVYGVQLEDGTQLPLMPSAQEPEKTAWIVKGTVLQFLTKENDLGEKLQT
ncbi:Smg8/Smg9 [Arabidopsis thaliana x Arabidopsis arenosa]|uniref:Nonsense-mediated mRNA decay factor SMG8 n=1 Tax=Arabidopsis thaliana x Arabidopsis arenosa TaxID=1240361 RepID=A0A8T2A5W4_9BRAS|nr:Smg8/Smg9 [Arabidopsis thaliana x Arabidopsis arenosa]